MHCTELPKGPIFSCLCTCCDGKWSLELGVSLKRQQTGRRVRIKLRRTFLDNSSFINNKKKKRGENAEPKKVTLNQETHKNAYRRCIPDGTSNSYLFNLNNEVILSLVSGFHAYELYDIAWHVLFPKLSGYT